MNMLFFIKVTFFLIAEKFLLYTYRTENYKIYTRFDHNWYLLTVLVYTYLFSWHFQPLYRIEISYIVYLLSTNMNISIYLCKCIHVLIQLIIIDFVLSKSHTVARKEIFFFRRGSSLIEIFLSPMHQPETKTFFFRWELRADWAYISSQYFGNSSKTRSAPIMISLLLKPI